MNDMGAGSACNWAPVPARAFRRPSAWVQAVKRQRAFGLLNKMDNKKPVI